MMDNRRDRPLVPWSFVYRVVLPLLGSVLIVASQKDSDWLLVVALFMWYICLAFPLMLEKSSWPFYAFWLLLTAYSSTAWLLEKYIGISYFGVSPNAIFEGTKLSLEGVLVSYIVVTLLTANIKWGRFFGSRVVRLHEKLAHMGPERFLFASLCLAAVGVADWLSISEAGLGMILFGARQAFRSNILSTYHLVTLITLPIAILLVSGLILRRQSLWERVIAIISLIIYWTPFIIVGYRRELIFVIIVALLLITFTSSLQKHRSILILGLLCAAVVYVFPFFVRGDISLGPVLEFVFPQYNLFLLMDNPGLYHDMQATYGFEKGVWLMFPQFLRPLYILPPGTIFQSEASLGMGLAFHPMAEAYLGSRELALLLFVLFTTAIILLTIWLAYADSAFAVIGFMYLLQWGRSDFWTPVVVIVYSGIVLSILLARIKVALVGGKASRPQVPPVESTRR